MPPSVAQVRIGDKEPHLSRHGAGTVVYTPPAPQLVAALLGPVGIPGETHGHLAQRSKAVLAFL